jgi:DNA-binding transcriptional LysR family regulator
MELRRLRNFLVVAQALNFTKAAAQLRVGQPALSRQVQDLEDEIGVDLLRRSPRGVTLTAEGKLFLEEVRELLKRAGESVEKIRALARGEYGELHVGYAPSPTVEILPPALAAFQKAVPGVKVLLHDLSSDELIAGLRDGTLELAIMVEPAGEQTTGIEFEVLRTYPLCVGMTTAHPFARLKSSRWRRWLPNHSSVSAARITPSITTCSTAPLLPSVPNRALRWNVTAPVRSSPKSKPDTASRS